MPIRHRLILAAMHVVGLVLGWLCWFAAGGKEGV
jgi:hypothetical protein